MQVDASTVVGLVVGFSVFNLILGYVIGHFGISAIKNDIEVIKGLINGQSKIIVASGAPSVVATTPSILASNS